MPDNVTLDPPITNVERLLAKAAGMEGVSVDEPETRIERYLKAICDRLDSGGSQLPDPTENDVGKVATVVNNEGTYEYGLETPTSGGGVLVVHSDADGILDKTWQEIVEAMASTGAVLVTVNGTVVDSATQIQNAYYDEEEPIPYIIVIGVREFASETADGYPASI